jgi:hypothetical protein
MTSENSNLNVEQLLKALENENNSSITNLNSQKIKTIKNNILQKLQLSSNELKTFHKKLQDYRYVEELNEIQFGSFIRWIPLHKESSEIKLTNGGFICDIKILNEGIHIRCRNNMGRIFQLKLDENLIFQKLNNQEKVLLSVIDYLDKK